MVGPRRVDVHVFLLLFLLAAERLESGPAVSAVAGDVADDLAVAFRTAAGAERSRALPMARRVNL